jgi:hypothetical protein
VELKTESTHLAHGPVPPKKAPAAPYLTITLGDIIDWPS